MSEGSCTLRDQSPEKGQTLSSSNEEDRSSPGDANLLKANKATTATSFPLRLERVPAGLKLRDLWSFFSILGNVTWIEIYPRRERQTLHSGKVVFNPPPEENFWNNGVVNIPLPTPADRENEARIVVAPLVNAPFSANKTDANGNKYPKINQVELSTLEFGSFVGTSTMAVVKSLQPSTPGEQFMEWSFASRKLTVYFTFPFHEGSATGKKHYKFTTDISLVKQV
jgi:RNA-dependent RNA polymerase